MAALILIVSDFKKNRSNKFYIQLQFHQIETTKISVYSFVIERMNHDLSLFYQNKQNIINFRYPTKYYTISFFLTSMHLKHRIQIIMETNFNRPHFRCLGTWYSAIQSEPKDTERDDIKRLMFSLKKLFLKIYLWFTNLSTFIHFTLPNVTD